MRFAHTVLSALLLCAIAVDAQGQDSPQPFAKAAPITSDDVVARLLSFNRNGDGRIEKGELANRMRRLVDDGDADGDRALNRGEIVRLTEAAQNRDRVLIRYGFGEEIELSFRTRVEGALEDLALSAPGKGPRAARGPRPRRRLGSVGAGRLHEGNGRRAHRGAVGRFPGDGRSAGRAGASSLAGPDIIAEPWNVPRGRDPATPPRPPRSRSSRARARTGPGGRRLRRSRCR